MVPLAHDTRVRHQTSKAFAACPMRGGGRRTRPGSRLSDGPVYRPSPMAGEERFLLKDLIDRPSVAAIFEAVAEVEPRFDPKTAMSSVFDHSFDGLELKQRIRRVARVLHDLLARPYREGLDVLVAAAKRLEGAGFAGMAFNDFVEEYGTSDFDASVPALAVFTKVVSAEFAVRPFIASDQSRMLAVMLEWAESEDPALRRLASEGSRPRLPWGRGLPSLKKDPSPTRPILQLLRSDSSEDVRRSVANHLNDISKDHPEYVVSLLAQWQDGSSEAAAITKHALRTLLKKGHPGALKLLGFDPDVAVSVGDLRLDPESVTVGDSTRARWVVVNPATESHDVMVDYAVSYHRADKAPSRKVFKGAVVELGPGEQLTQSRKLSLAQMSTRRVEAGPHTIEVQINGVVKAKAEFEVVEPDD